MAAERDRQERDWQPHPDWLLPQWPAPVRVRAVFTTRAGGVSQGPFESLNLGRPSGDDPAAVDANRARLAQALGAEPIYLSQVHGVETLELPLPASSGQPAPVAEADACVTAARGVVCTMRVADCLPVLYCHREGIAVGAAHAGWRGLAAGVLESAYRGYAALCARQGLGDARTLARDTLAWLGPCIGPDAFEVGAEVREAFLAHDPAAANCFSRLPQHKWLADLQGLARQRLAKLGLQALHGNDGSPGWCTVGNPSRFFSHRRDAVRLGGSGRMAACIWIR